MRKLKKNQKGFTLAEELVTVILIGVLVTTASGILMNALRIFSRNVITLNAQAKGIAVMDQLADHLTYAEKIDTASTFSNDEDCPYQIMLYPGTTDGKHYLYAKSSLKFEKNETAHESAAPNVLCTLGAYSAEYTITQDGVDYAVIELKINRHGSTWYSEKRTVFLANQPFPADGSVFSYSSTSGGMLHIGSIE